MYIMALQGHQGRLRGRTFSAPRKWAKGKGRITCQFGCCYNYAIDREGRKPGQFAALACYCVGTPSCACAVWLLLLLCCKLGKAGSQVSLLLWPVLDLLTTDHRLGQLLCCHFLPGTVHVLFGCCCCHAVNRQGWKAGHFTALTAELHAAVTVSDCCPGIIPSLWMCGNAAVTAML